MKLILKKRKALVAMTLLGTLSLLACVFLLGFDTAPKVEKKPNKWFEITIPSPVANDEAKEFKYKKVLQQRGNNTCIDRSQFTHEFSRIFGYDTSTNDYKSPQILIVGSHTALGEALVRKYTKKEVPFTAIKGITDVDFTSPDIDTLFTNMTFTGALIVDQPALDRHANNRTTDQTISLLHDYFKGLTKFLHRRNISFVVALPRAVSSIVMEKTLKHGGCYVDVPYSVDADALYDLENPLMRAARECLLVKSTVVDLHENEYIQSYTADEAAKFIRKQLKTQRTGHFSIYGNTNMTIKEAISKIVSPKCKVDFKESIQTYEQTPLSDQNAMVGDEKAQVDVMLQDAFKYFQNSFDSSPYASFVIVGRHDNFSKGFEQRAERFIQMMASNFKKVPLASFEIVFVDYAGPVDAKPLRDIFTIPTYLKNRFRFIEVPLLYHVHLSRTLKSTVPFLEYFAKNIGIRRSNAEFVITLNPDDLLSPALFEFIASRQFNPGVLYRAIRWDLVDGWEKNYTLENVMDAFGSLETLQTIKPKKRCNVGDHFALINSQDSFNKYSNLCGSGDFIMLSKQMWEAVDGFIEYPANPNIDSSFSSKMLRLIPGFFRHFFRIPILHQYHQKKNIMRRALENQSTITSDFICTGSTPLLIDYPDTPNWGLINDHFNEYRK